MLHLHLFEDFTTTKDYPLYHYTKLSALEGILSDGFIEGYAGSVYDEEEGETISVTTNANYHTHGHDISGECRLAFYSSRLKKDYQLYPVDDESYSEIMVAQWMKQGMSEEEATWRSKEDQEVIMTAELPITYVENVTFFVAPPNSLTRALDAAGIPYAMGN